jgi:holo-[acyl-carrier protein] synthase
MKVSNGIDLVSVGRLKEKMERTPLLEKRIFTDAEIEYCRSKANSYQHFAGRFAAKEAIYKALSFLGVPEKPGWKDIEIISAEGSSPFLSKDSAAVRLIGKTKYSDSLSITHENDYAAAVYTIAVEEE